jgi:7,8-dihydropterin-6-yl-methyl-4-(beta-D-ribofuranosyl)aminobenzene 5'-phosphate synthase
VQIPVTTKPLKIQEVEKLTVVVITDNYYDSVRPQPAIGQRFGAAPGASIHAEHGLSYFIETVVNGASSAFMFDYGLDPHGVINNMGLLDVDLSRVDALGLSHGHFDHWGGLAGILRQNQSKMRKGTPLYMGNEIFAHRFSLRPGIHEPHDIGQLRKEEIESFGTVNIVEISDPVEVIPGCYYTGNIERVTDYEKVPEGLLIERNGELEHDLFEGEQAVVFSLKGKGLVILSGCAHAGIVNTVKHAQKITGIKKVHAVIGGFHLVNVKPEIIRRTVADIKTIGPDYIVPAHCTGLEAVMAFIREMPDQFILSTAGTKYVMTS